MQPDIEWWAVPKCWPGEVVAILAGGQSLTQDQVDRCREARVRVIAINRRYEMAPYADWLFACDIGYFWRWYPAALDFAGTKVAVRTANPSRRDYARMAELHAAGVRILRHSALEVPATPRHEGVSLNPAVVRGNNSLFQVLSVIAHTGATTVILLGADMRGGRGYDYPTGASQSDYAISVIPPFATLMRPLADAGVTVLNCTPRSALLWWPQMRLEDVL